MRKVDGRVYHRYVLVSPLSAKTVTNDKGSTSRVQGETLSSSMTQACIALLGTHWSNYVSSAVRKVSDSPRILAPKSKSFKSQLKMSEIEFLRLAYEGKYDVIKNMTENDRKWIITRDKSARYPIHWACVGGHTDVVNFLLQQESPIDEPDDSHWTPLMIASSVGKDDIVSTLITRGADVKVVNQTGQTPLHYASSKEHVQVAKVLLEHHADINAADNMGSTPLHRAASKGNLKILHLFLESYKNKLDLDAQDAVGNTPLHLACEEDRGEVARILVQNGARTDILNKEKKTPLDIAPVGLKRTLQAR